MRRLSLAFVLVSAAATAACGSSSSNNNNGGDSGTGNPPPPENDGGPTTDATTPVGTDAGTSPEAGTDSGPVQVVSSTYPAPHPAWPVLLDQGEPVLHTPTVYTVTFNADPNATQLAAFGAQATNNAYWDAVRAGYCETGSTTNCVGGGTTGTSKVVTATLAASYADSQDPASTTNTLQPFIQGLIAKGTIATPTDQTLVVFYFPATTTITLDGAASCQQFGGYHHSMLTKTGGTQFAYAIVPECAAATGQTLTVLQETTLAASHEIIEAATDPYAVDQGGNLPPLTGFYQNWNDPASLYVWNPLGDGEVADMCVDQIGLGTDEYVEGGFTVQRSWNVAAAAAGGDPCVPALPAGTPYFNTTPEQWLATTAVGSTTTFNADAFSNMAVPSGWTVIGYDSNATSSTNLNPYITVTFNGAKSMLANNGFKVPMAVTLNAEPSADMLSSTGGALGFLISYNGATLAKSTFASLWPFIVQSDVDGEDGGAGFIGFDASMDIRRPANGIRLSKAQVKRAYDTIRASQQ